MPPLLMLVLSLLMLSPPTYAITLLLLDQQTPPKRRAVRAIGSSIVMKSLIVISLCLIGLSLGGRWSLGLPILLGCMVCIIAFRIMQIENTTDHHPTPYFSTSHR